LDWIWCERLDVDGSRDWIEYGVRDWIGRLDWEIGLNMVWEIGLGDWIEYGVRDWIEYGARDWIGRLDWEIGWMWSHIDVYIYRRVWIDIGLDRLPTDRREGGREGIQMALCRSPEQFCPVTTHIPALLRRALPCLFWTEILFYIGNPNWVGKRGFGYKMAPYMVWYKRCLMIRKCVYDEKIEILFLDIAW
jgi:hypothetical protein